MGFREDDLTFTYSDNNPGATSTTLTVSGSPSTIYTIFRRAHEALDMDSLTVSSAGPRVRCLTSDIASVNKRVDTMTVGGTEYVLKQIQPIIDGLESYVVFGNEATVISDTSYAPGAATNIPQPSITITANYTVAVAPGTIIFIDATAGNIAVTMPAAASFEEYTHTLTRIDSSAYTVTVLAASGETINEAASVVIVGKDSRNVYSDGTELRLT